MPEGDTVWNTARVLERALAGDVLTGSDFRVPQLATTDLTGWTVAESASPFCCASPGTGRPGRCTRTCGWRGSGARTLRVNGGSPGRRI
jgi:hypothetical protein